MLGLISAVYCAIQLFWINQAIIRQYQADPNPILNKFGIEPGSFRQMLFENALYSKDIRAFSFVTPKALNGFATQIPSSYQP